MNKENVKRFLCCGKQMVLVKLENSAHIMDYDEWKKVYGNLHPERWKKSKDKKNRKIA